MSTNFSGEFITLNQQRLDFYVYSSLLGYKIRSALKMA